MESETTQSGGFFEFLAWLEVNKKKLLLGAVALVVLGFAIGIYRWYANQQELAANKALLELRTSLNAETNKPAATAQDFLKVAQAYSATRAGERAMLLYAGRLFVEGQYAEAQKQFEKFLSEKGSSLLAVQAVYGVAACLDALNDTDKALAKYQEVITRYPTEAVAGQAKLAIARLYEAKNTEDQAKLALNIYDELLKAAGVSVWSGEARSKRELLLQKYPNLVVTNAPVMISTNPGLNQAISALTNRATNPAPATAPAPVAK